MRFTLEIELGNEAMQTYGDLSQAMQKLMRRMDQAEDMGFMPHDAAAGGILDENGNKVGSWSITE